MRVANWILQDDGSDLAVGDLWLTQIAISLDTADPVDGTPPLGLELITDPRSVAGPRYRLTARVRRDNAFGTVLDTGTWLLNPLAVSPWPEGSQVTVESALFAGQQLDLRPEHPAWRQWRVDEIHLRQWDSIPDTDRNSSRAEPSSLRIRQIPRTHIWVDEKDATTGAEKATDYLFKLA